MTKRLANPKPFADNLPKRRGNGPGWGGPAKGEGKHLAKPDAFEPGNTLGHIATPEVRRAAQDDREEVLAFYREVFRNPAEGTNNRLVASEKLLDRQEGRARQSVEMSGPDGKPLGSFVIFGEREKASTDEWAKDHLPGA